MSLQLPFVPVDLEQVDELMTNQMEHFEMPSSPPRTIDEQLGHGPSNSSLRVT
ncbi:MULTISPECIES: hypothetical protein [Paenibacillus]|uniref:hypothetical protein n=1 Tax=Paenibacillus TaxID=44249 RepID=UPI00158F1246|nr:MULTISPECIES: hypothetical protein [Paenibacillus]